MGGASLHAVAECSIRTAGHSVLTRLPHPLPVLPTVLVAAILKHLGIITDTTRLAGASGGASVAVLTCANVTAQQQYRDQLSLASRCRASANCQGILDQASNESISAGGASPRCTVDA